MLECTERGAQDSTILSAQEKKKGKRHFHLVPLAGTLAVAEALPDYAAVPHVLRRVVGADQSIHRPSAV